MNLPFPVLNISLENWRKFVGCCCVTENVVYMDESRILQSHFYDNTVTFKTMLDDLKVPSDPSLPEALCEECAELAIKAFLFQKLCHFSYNKWNETVNRLAKIMSHTESILPTVRTAFLLTQKENEVILTSRKVSKNKSKTELLYRIKNLLKKQKRKRKSGKSNNNEKHPCTFCHKSFLNSTGLDLHVDRLHKPKTIQCPKCPKKFSSEKMLKDHDTLHHIPAECTYCSIKFPSKKDLRLHNMHRHEDIKCPRCSKDFKTKVIMKKHMKICGDDKKKINVYCDICNKGYKCKNSLRSHIIVEHGFGKTYTCKWCDKKYDAISRLQTHVVKHTKERNFTCEICGCLFVTKPALIYHTRIHTGEKPFPCDLCKESFLSASRRMEHKRRKHFERKHHCRYCDSKFTTKFGLNKHEVRHTDPHSRLYICENDN